MTQFEATRAFPRVIATRNAALIEKLAASATRSVADNFDEFQYRSETLVIPRRLYYSVSELESGMSGSGDGAIVAACLGSKSTDGYVRQKSIELLVTDPRDWSIPYVVDVLGDYLLEILQVVEGRIPGELEPDYAAYLLANEERFVRLCRRCVSYWNEFDRFAYGGLYPDWKSYPGARVIADLVAAARAVEPTFGRELAGILPNRRAAPRTSS